MYDLLWIRTPFMDSDRDWGAVVVHGHVVVEEPQFRPNRIGIDTGAYKSGCLTCLVAMAGVPRHGRCVRAGHHSRAERKN